MARLPRVSPVYLALHSNTIKRQALYRAIFTSHVEGQLLADIRVHSHKGMAIGNESFKQEIEALTGTRMKHKKMGRPANSQKKKLTELQALS